MAKLLGCSYAVLWKHLNDAGLQTSHRFSRIPDSDLDVAVRDIHSSFPNAGCEVS